MTDLSRRMALGLVAAAPAAVWLAVRPAMAAEPMVYQEGGIAIDGSDVVAYFEGNGPVAGMASITHDWNGARWQFATEANRDAFAADPEAYAPVFGGYCAFAASRGYLAPTIPEAWTIHEGRLYLNASIRVRRRWLRDIDENIAAGLANWPAILG